MTYRWVLSDTHAGREFDLGASPLFSWTPGTQMPDGGPAELLLYGTNAGGAVTRARVAFLVQPPIR